MIIFQQIWLQSKLSKLFGSSPPIYTQENLVDEPGKLSNFPQYVIVLRAVYFVQGQDQGQLGLGCSPPRAEAGKRKSAADFSSPVYEYQFQLYQRRSQKTHSLNLGAVWRGKFIPGYGPVSTINNMHFEEATKRASTGLVSEQIPMLTTPARWASAKSVIYVHTIGLRCASIQQLLCLTILSVAVQLNFRVYMHNYKSPGWGYIFSVGTVSLFHNQ